MPDIDLEDYAEQLGNPDEFFVDEEGRERPLIVRHADGVPAFAVEADNTLTPYEAPAPTGAGVEANLDHRAEDSRFAGG